MRIRTTLRKSHAFLFVLFRLATAFLDVHRLVYSKYKSVGINQFHIILLDNHAWLQGYAKEAVVEFDATKSVFAGELLGWWKRCGRG